MKRNSQKVCKYAGLFSAICGGLLISTPVISSRAVAQQWTSQVNPCPRIYYEEPHNNRVIVPQGCPPNALTQKLAPVGQLPPSRVPGNQMPLGVGGELPNAVTQEPLVPGISPSQAVPARPPEAQQLPSAQIALANGRVNIRLINDTGAEVTYEIIGDTPMRSLAGKSEMMLRDLTAPVTLTFFRADGGLLQVTPQPSAETGMMEVRLKATTDVQNDKNSLRIQEDGTVFLN
ncbi:MAG TPA: hypothetical protein VE956_09680 [Nodularia sp. (in: cyanobacteria)]|nr:hypothetical protein [Nodularia sp. (in: cyanobacteria)]